MKKLKQILIEQEIMEKFNGFLGIKIDIPERTKYIDKIDKEDLTHKEIENDVHLTILYGFKNNIEGGEIQQMFEKINLKEFTIETSKIDLFENEEYDVLKYNFKVPKELKEARDFLMKEFDVKTDYKELNAHSTLAYLKSGEGKKYVTRLDDKITINVDQLYFEDYQDRVTYINLNSDYFNSDIIQ